MRKIIKNRPDLVPVEIANLELEPEIVAGSFDPPTTDAVANAVGAVEEVIPPGTDEDNPLVNAQNLADAIDAASLEGTPAEVAAAALCELKYNQDNMAEEFAELDSRISALENAESVNANRTTLSAPSIKNKLSVNESLEREIKETPAAVEGDENELADAE